MSLAEELYPNGIETPPPGGGNFELPPEGLYPAVCALFMDLGIQETAFGDKHRVKYVYLLNENNSEGKPYMIFTKPMTLSSNERSSLFKLIKGWNVIAPTFEANGSFQRGLLPAHIGKQATINVVHNQVDDKAYANIESVAPPLKGMDFEVPQDERIDKLVENIKAHGGIYVREERQEAPAHTDADKPLDIKDVPIPEETAVNSDLPF